MINCIKHIPLVGAIFQKTWNIHKEALAIFFISWLIVNIPLLLKFLINLNDGIIIFPCNITDIIVYSISFLAPFVFCYKKTKNSSNMFRDSKEAYLGVLILIVVISMLSTYYTISPDKLAVISEQIICVLYFISMFLWYFSILMTISNDKLEENAENANLAIRYKEQQFVEEFNESIKEEQADE